MDDPRAGTLLGGTYRLTRRIGRGGFGAVYEALHLRLPKRFAVKVLDEQAARDPTVFARFRREAEMAGSLGHPNIVQVIDFNHAADGAPYMVLEYLEGEDLGERLERQGALGIAETLAIAEPLASALDAAHRRRIVHRDIKPSNVFLVRGDDGAETVKLLDFGIAKLLDSPEVLTRTGTLVGTVQYMAPEQARGAVREVDAVSDVFSLAALLYRMLAGCDAFAGAHGPTLLYRICKAPHPPIRSVRPDLPEPIERVIDQGLAKRKADRIASAGALVAALRGAAEAAGAIPGGPAAVPAIDTLQDSHAHTVELPGQRPRR